MNNVRYRMTPSSIFTIGASISLGLRCKPAFASLIGLTDFDTFPTGLDSEADAQ